ncbi:MAG: nitroreductase family protein [Thermodesulfovibrionales bacterium]
MIGDIVRRSRSYRRFYQSKEVSTRNLEGLVNLARLSPSAGNLQPLKYLISNEPEMNSSIFQCLAWAGYLKDWPGPAEGERPSAYIVILGDTGITKNFGCDHGIAAQTIMLAAAEHGLGGCIIASINKGRLREALAIPEELEILLVLALGKPKETVIIEDLGEDGEVKYWRDEKGVHHVPKRRLEEIILRRP